MRSTATPRHAIRSEGRDSTVSAQALPGDIAAFRGRFEAPTVRNFDKRPAGNFVKAHGQVGNLGLIAAEGADVVAFLETLTDAFMGTSSVNAGYRVLISSGEIVEMKRLLS
jgi:hypothetical protein